MTTRPCRRWRAAELRYLDRWWGISPTAAIARALGRSPGAVLRMATRRRLSLKRDCYTARQVARELGVTGHTVSYWIGCGMLRPHARRAQCWLIPYDELARFIRLRVLSPSPQTQWRWQQMPRGWWRNYASDVAREVDADG